MASMLVLILGPFSPPAATDPSVDATSVDAAGAGVDAGATSVDAAGAGVDAGATSVDAAGAGATSDIFFLYIFSILYSSKY